MTEGVWNEVVQLPRALMAEARLLRHQAPVKAAVLAQVATAIAILSFAPIRLGNLIQIRLEENLIKPGSLDGPYWLVFPHYDVKNRVQLNFKLVPQVCDIIDEYIQDFRSVLMRGSNERWLFPGETGGVKALQQRRYCDAFALWQTCPRTACRRQRRCGGEAADCLRRALDGVPHPAQWRARQDILEATPRNIGAPERAARQCMPRDLYE